MRGNRLKRRVTSTGCRSGAPMSFLIPGQGLDGVELGGFSGWERVRYEAWCT